MKINSLIIRNYRCFKEQKITFENNLTLFVGQNGAGKTAILDAAAVAVSTFLCGIQGGVSKNIQKEDARYEFYDMNGIIDSQPQFPVVIEAAGECNGKSGVEWTRSLNSLSGDTTKKDAYQLTKIAAEMQHQVMEGNTDLILPVLSYYGTGRLYAQKREKKDKQKLQQFNRQIGYLDCMAAESNEKLMLSWFEKMTLKSLQNQQKTDVVRKNPQLVTVEEAICKCFKSIRKCKNVEVEFDLDTHRLVVTYEEASGAKFRFAMNELSDGYKNTLSMIADIAYRMAVLNPQLGAEVLEKTPGIVLIDEVDLHLHPQWQQTILGDLQTIFPEVQFLVTSHAPAVINSVKQENIRILNHEEIYLPAAQTYGRDVNSILREVMQVEERPQNIQKELFHFYDALDEGDTDKAEQILRNLQNIIGGDDSEINAAWVKLDFAKMQEERN